MSLAHGIPYLAIPGPSVMPEAVLRAMHRSAPNIYEGELVETTASLIPDLKKVARTRHDVALYIANGHGAWEAAIANTLAPGDKALVLAVGRFGHGWADMARAMGIEVDILDFGLRDPVDFAKAEEALTQDSGHTYKAVLATHVDTASSVLTRIGAVREVMDRAGHPALLMADCIASLACDRFEMDAWGVDVMVAASQKGLMVPPGLGLVYFNDKAAAVRQAMPRVSRYWDWTPRANPEEYYQYFGGTAATHHIYGLRVALDMLLDEGLDAIWARHETLARALWAACDAWGRGGPMEMNVVDPADRSHAVTAMRIGAPHGGRLREWTQEHAGVTLGIGLGMADSTDPAFHGFFRFGHMGHVNAHMMLGLLGTVQAGMEALAIPFGAGALDAAAKIIADPVVPQQVQQPGAAAF